MRSLKRSDNHVPTVNIILKNEKDEILLKRRNVGPFKGSWILPGGHIDVQVDSAEGTAIREVKEETGLTAVLTHLVGVKTNTIDPRSPFIFKVIYEARVDSGLLTKNVEVDDFRWLPLDKARKEKLGFDHHEILKLYSTKKDYLLPIERSRYTEWYGKTFPYAQTEYPRVACMGIILNEKKEILLGLKARKPFADHWNFPGGHMYVNETPESVWRVN